MVRLIQNPRPELMNKKLKIPIFIIFISLAGFLVLPDFSEAQETPQCDLKDVIFNPSGKQSSDWFSRRNRESSNRFTVTLIGNGNCSGKTLQEVTLVNTQGLNDDIEALNDQQVTFNQGSNQIVFTFVAGEEGCAAGFGTSLFNYDCNLEFFVRSEGTPRGFWSTEASRDRGRLTYNCESGWNCDRDITFRLLGTQGGRVGTPTVSNSICAYVAPNNIYACISNSNQQASQNQCSRVSGCQGRNCLVINPSLCGQPAGGQVPPGGGQVPPGGGQVPPGGGQVPGQPVSVSFNIPNPIAAESLVDLAKAIGKFLFQIAIPIAVIIIIYAGLLFLTSGGNKEKITKARTALLYAIVGLAIILIGQGFFTLIKSILELRGPPIP